MFNKFKEKMVLSFKDLSYEYQNHFILESVLASLLLISLSVFFILIKSYMYIAGLFFIYACYMIYILNIIYKSLCNEILVINCVCIDVDKKESNLFGLKELGSKTCTITLKTDSDILLSQVVPYSSNYSTGNNVRIYFNKNSLSQINTNTYTIINPVFMHIIKS